MGEAGLARARKLFTWQRVTQGLVHSYRRAMGSSGRRGRGIAESKSLRAGARG